jgi:nitric oxide reductase activation protein
MSKLKITYQGLLTEKEQSLPNKEKEKLIEIRIKDEELRIKNDMEAEERERRLNERLKRKFDAIQKEEEELALVCKISKENYMTWIRENVDLRVFAVNPDLHIFCLNLI